MVDPPGVVAVGDADEPRRDFRPAAADLPIEMGAFNGGDREIAQDEVEGGLLLKQQHQGVSAVGDALDLVPLAGKDIRDERACRGWRRSPGCTLAWGRSSYVSGRSAGR